MANKPKTPAPKAATSTQQYLDIQEIRDNVVIMKDGSLRGVLLVSSINFSLKSEEEQEAVIGAYTQFLNTIDYPLQIVVQSRPLQISGYLDKISAVEKKQTNQLLKLQMGDYRQFVGELVKIADIMTKRFYLVVPYTPAVDRPGKFFSRMFSVFTPATTIHLKIEQFDHYRRELLKRIDNTMVALQSAGLQSAMLDTQSLIELYYTSYNPETSMQEKMQDTASLNIDSSQTAAPHA